ncbi:NAD(P)H-dependent oxidoreductase [Derxia lacustris]|uniref:NAD(P)H-dependent oxidoreductase n=1 Tax=Derxia lacustris TaxID=764842 RepID=UPI000A175DE0|nr:NAD(P)H-dependent oxidoreductase [Derxia lacustris]
MSSTLVLVFHPRLADSRANRALMNAAAGIDGASVVDMAADCPDGRIDADRAVARLLAADRVVLQFPLQWYSAPALLRAWQDEVLTRMFYVRAEEGARLAGRALRLAVTAGNVPEAYCADGVNGFALDQLLLPFAATARRCGLAYAEPFVLYGAGRLDDAELAAAGMRYRRTLEAWIAATPASRELA